MNWVRKIVKEPLIHFACIGVATFMLFNFVAPNNAGLSDKVIVVDKESLLTHMQFRSKSFKPDQAAKRFDEMTEEELEQMIAAYVREEALHREAKAMGMEQNDYLIKRRLIQKVEYLAQGFVDANINIQEADLQQYLKDNKDEYFIEPNVTFTHVFFNAEIRGSDNALTAAKNALTELNLDKVPFNDAGKYSDNFYYGINYVEKSENLIVSHFGPEIAKKIFNLPAGDGVWHGPFESEYGSHLILIAKSEPGRYPTLAEVRPILMDDMRRTQAQEKLDAAINEIIAGYEIRRELQRPAAKKLNDNQLARMQ